MIHIPVNIATEDELSEVVLTRLLRFSGRKYWIGTAYRRGGYGYLKKTVPAWNRAAVRTPFLILTDLDEVQCPSKLISDWLNEPVHSNLLVRIAVREVESWLLADSGGLAAYLRVSTTLIPEHPDELADPKAVLVSIARKSRSRDIKSRILPKDNSTAKQGPDYNSCLSAFVTERWDIESAIKRSPSLKRAVARYATFVPSWA